MVLVQKLQLLVAKEDIKIQNRISEILQVVPGAKNISAEVTP